MIEIIPSLKLRYLDIIESAVDGPGLRTVVFLSGCNHRCPGCHNTLSWDYWAGKEISSKELADKIAYFGNKKVTISGGDPFFQSEPVLYLIKELHNWDITDIWIYSGYTYEQLQKSEDVCSRAILREASVLVDGPFVESLKSEEYLYRGSSNQKIIDLKTGKELEYLRET